MKKDPTTFRERFKAWKEGKPITDIYNKGLPKHDEGSPMQVGEYNVYPSAIGASELNVTTPEIVVKPKPKYPDTSDYYLWNPKNFTILKYIDNKIKKIVSKEGGDINAVRNRIYKNIIPYGYGIRDLYEAEDSYNKNNGRKFARRGIRPSFFGQLEEEFGDVREALWAKYLGLPTFTYEYYNEGLKTDSVKNILRPSEYKPKKGATIGDVVSMPRHYTYDYELSDKALATLYRSALAGDSIVPLANSPTLGRYTGSIGTDSLGNYISYYDEWDLNPFNSAGYNVDDIRGIFVPSSVYKKPDILNEYGISRPYSVYDRRYYTEYELQKALDKYDKNTTDLILKEGSIYSKQTNERVK